MKKEIQQHGPNSAVYGFGFIGAVIYYISNATGFWIGALGILKAIVWPAFLVYEALKTLGA
jgi:amino acid permease